MTSTDLMHVEGISKRFSGLMALDNVSFSVPGGTITGLIGPNGSGKSTTINIVTGALRPDEGSVTFAGTSITGRSLTRVAKLGLARTFQHAHLFGDLTVLDNLRLGQHLAVGRDRFSSFLAAGAATRRIRKLDEDVLQLADQLMLTEWLYRPAREVPLGLQKIVGVGRAIARRPQLLVLDEPAAGLNEEESRKLADTLRELPAAGTSVLIVEHDLDVVFGLCEHVVVLDHGQVLFEGTAADVRKDASVIAAYLGAPE